MPNTATALFLMAMAAALPAQAQTAAPRPSATAPSRAAATAPSSLASNQFSTEPAAKAHCPGDAIVWANLGSTKAYHPSGDRYYGKTKHGAYMCQKEADQAGFHAAGRRPSKAAAVKSTSSKAAH
ncbi:MAG TPA: hypothetical protein VMS01_06375 [Stellaceae bacterium]|nr:hypothetical protein [Stellaceae bacterium]